MPICRTTASPRIRRAATLALASIAVAIAATQSVPACELFGISADHSVALRGHFLEMQRRGTANPHGWGIALYRDLEPLIIKEAACAEESPLAHQVSLSPILEAPLALVHVRRASIGGQRDRNTHPFTREFGGRRYALVHNGTLRNLDAALPLGRWRPVGECDTEHLLCYLMDRLEKRNIKDWARDDFEWLEKTLREINDAGSLNCLFADGERLFAYHDKNGYNTLHFLVRHKPGGVGHFVDRKADLNLTETHAGGESAWLFATAPLTDENWRPMPPGKLTVLRSGRLLHAPDEIVDARSQPSTQGTAPKNTATEPNP